MRPQQLLSWNTKHALHFPQNDLTARILFFLKMTWLPAFFFSLASSGFHSPSCRLAAVATKHATKEFLVRLQHLIHRTLSVVSSLANIPPRLGRVRFLTNLVTAAERAKSQGPDDKPTGQLKNRTCSLLCFGALKLSSRRTKPLKMVAVTSPSVFGGTTRMGAPPPDKNVGLFEPTSPVILRAALPIGPTVWLRRSCFLLFSDSSLPANPDSSYDPGQPGPAHLAGLRLHSLAANPTTNIASDTGLAGASRTSSPFRVRTGVHFAERAGGGGARMSRSMSSRSRRTTSVSSPIRPLMPTARGLGGALEGPAPRAPSSSTRALAGGSRRVLLFSPSGGGSADGMYRDREAPRGSLLPSQPHQQHQQNQHQQPPPQHQQHQQPHQHPPTAGGCSLRVPARHGGGAGRADGGRASVRRLASGGGRDPWRAPAVAYNAAERRTGRDTTALRVVSARLDAAATASFSKPSPLVFV